MNGHPVTYHSAFEKVKGFATPSGGGILRITDASTTTYHTYTIKIHIYSKEDVNTKAHLCPRRPKWHSPSRTVHERLSRRIPTRLQSFQTVRRLVQACQRIECPTAGNRDSLNSLLAFRKSLSANGLPQRNGRQRLRHLQQLGNISQSCRHRFEPSCSSDVLVA